MEAYYQCCADTVQDRALLDMVEQVGGDMDSGRRAVRLYFHLALVPSGQPTHQHDFSLIPSPQLLYEPCFDTLRTKEQLGYSVHSGTRRTHGLLGLCVVVVSGAHGPAHLDVRIEAFLASFAATLAEMGEEEFEKQRQALLAIKMMKVRASLPEPAGSWCGREHALGQWRALLVQCDALPSLF